MTKVPDIAFDEYIRTGEPDRQEKASIWQAAIGLQAVDGLQTSEYLKETARKHIEGQIDIDEARSLIKSYYQTKSVREPDDEEKQEADQVSANITKILSSPTVDFSTAGVIALHRRIFEGVLKHAGQLRDYDITKHEWVLDNDTVRYLNWEDLRRALDYDIGTERSFSYQGLSDDEMICHLTRFVAGLWQIHPFGEGNTRTTAVFTIQYLRSIGFKVNNDLFARHSWYFRNALVRANYKNARLGIDYSPIYLERFFRNLLLDEDWDLRSRYLHIHPSEEWSVQPRLSGPANCENPASTQQVPSKYSTRVSPAVELLIDALGNEKKSIRELLETLGLKDRNSFIKLYLRPALDAELVRPVYPDSPRHPRQQYLLTESGLTLWHARNADS